MTIAITRMAGTGSGTDATSYTRSYQPTASKLSIATVGVERTGSTNPNTPTVTHNSITATLIDSFLYVTSGTTRYKLFLFAWDSGAGSGSAQTWTADFAGVTHHGAEMNIFEVSGTDLAHGVAQCFVQVVKTTADATGTSGSITLAAPTNANNRPMAVWAHSANEEHSISNWTSATNVAHANPNAAMKEGYLLTAWDTAAAATWTTSTNYGGMAFEIKSADLSMTMGMNIGF